jgi:hypothetical protein
MHLCHYLGFGGYQGATVCTLVTQTLPSLFLIIYIKEVFNFHYRGLFINGLKIILCNIIMMIILYLFKFIYPIDSLGRFGALIECFVYGIIGSLVYIFLLVKTGLFKDLFGNSRLLKKFKLIK